MLARVYTAVVNLGYSMVAYVVMLIVFRITPSWTMLFYPVVVFFLSYFRWGFRMFWRRHVYFWRYKTFVFCITDLMALLFGNFLSGRFLERICKRNGSGESDL